jgi:hypothetical protein
VEHVRVLDPLHRRDVNRAPVRERPEAVGRPPAPTCRAHERRRGDADHDLAIALQGDQRGEDADAAHELTGAVDGVHDPARSPSRRVAAGLLAKHDVVGPGDCDALADGLLDGAVDGRDGAAVQFILERQPARLEVGAGDLVRDVG